MLANFFGKSTPISFMALVVLFLGNFTLAIFVQEPSLFETEHPLSTIFQSLFLVLFYLFFFVFILRKNKLTLDNFYALLLVISFFGFFPDVVFSTHQLVIHTVLLILLRKIFSLRTPANLIEKVFDCGFWFAILVLVDTSMLPYGILVYIGILLFQTLNFRTLTLPILGAITPTLIYITYTMWFYPAGYLDTFFTFSYSFSTATVANTPDSWVLFGWLFITGMAILLKSSKVYGISGNYRKFWTLVLLVFLLACVLILGNPLQSNALRIGLCFPMAIIIANWIETLPIAWVKEVFLALIILGPFVLAIV